MLPVLFSIGNFNVSSFGFFLTIAFLLGIFLVWRLSRAWDLDEEKILDLILLTFLGGLIGARIYFVINNLNFFGLDLLKIILIPKYPGFSFWGGFLGGWLTLYFFVRKFKMDFWLVADIASIGFLGGLIISDLGCFLGSCFPGTPPKLFLLEALLLLFVFSRLWKRATHFHLCGIIISLTLIYTGIVKVITSFFRPVSAPDFIFPITLIILGATIFYQQVPAKSGRTLISDMKRAISFLAALLTKKEARSLLLLNFKKSWYNQKTALSWKLRRMRVKSTG